MIDGVCASYSPRHIYFYDSMEKEYVCKTCCMKKKLIEKGDLMLMGKDDVGRHIIKEVEFPEAVNAHPFTF